MPLEDAENHWYKRICWIDTRFSFLKVYFGETHKHQNDFKKKKRKNFMILVSKETFLDMFEKKILTSAREEMKRWSITKNQKRYVGDDVWEQYQLYLKNASIGA